MLFQIIIILKPMKNIIYAFVIALLTCCTSKNANEDLLDQLDEEIERESINRGKLEHRIDSLRFVSSILEEKSEKKLKVYEDLYQIYATYNFDSAKNVIKKQKELACEMGNKHYDALADIHWIELMTTGGFFSELDSYINNVSLNELSNPLKLEYFKAAEWAYNRWADYLNDDEYTPYYHKIGLQYQDSILAYSPKGSVEHLFWKACSFWQYNQIDSAIRYYEMVLDATTPNDRMYASAAYNLSQPYRRIGNDEMADKYLIISAISDRRRQQKENLALQELAHNLNLKGHDVERANKYLSISMEDALFYNNRLRLVQLAHRYPPIVDSYIRMNHQQNQKLWCVLLILLFMIIVLITDLLRIRRQSKSIHNKSAELTKLNEDLKVLNAELSEANTLQETINRHLETANQKLKDTNESREQYVTLFIDLCSTYIDKIQKYKLLVKRKVTNHQAEDLLKNMGETRLSETDAKEFFMHFDTAFLNLYPHFVEEFNKLLNEGEEIIPKKGELLNTDLRIFALVRLGIKDSVKISNLLFYSLQTIYNRRTNVRNKARNRDAFEDQVEHLCE